MSLPNRIFDETLPGLERAVETHIAQHDLLSALDATDLLADRRRANRFLDRIYGIYGDYTSQLQVIHKDLQELLQGAEPEGPYRNACLRFLTVLRKGVEAGFVPGIELISPALDYLRLTYSSLLSELAESPKLPDRSSQEPPIVRHLLEATRGGLYIAWLLDRADGHRGLTELCSECPNAPLNLLMNNLETMIEDQKHDYVETLLALLENAERLRRRGLLDPERMSSYLSDYFEHRNTILLETPPESEFVKNVIRCHSLSTGPSKEVLDILGVPDLGPFLKRYLDVIAKSSLERAWGYQRARMVQHLLSITDCFYESGLGSLGAFASLLTNYVLEQYRDLLGEFSLMDNEWIERLDKLPETTAGTIYTVALAAQVQHVEVVTKEMGSHQPDLFSTLASKKVPDDGFRRNIDAMAAPSRIGSLPSEQKRIDHRGAFASQLQNRKPNLSGLPMELQVVSLFRQEEALQGSLGDVILNLRKPKDAAWISLRKDMFAYELERLMDVFGNTFLSESELSHEWTQRCSVLADCLLHPVYQDSDLVLEWREWVQAEALFDNLFRILIGVSSRMEAISDYGLLYRCARLLVNFEKHVPLTNLVQTVRRLIYRAETLIDTVYFSVQYYYWSSEDKTIKDGLVSLAEELHEQETRGKT